VTDPDLPESVPTVQPVWVFRDCASFSPVYGWAVRDVAVPFPWRPVPDRVFGILYAPLWRGQATKTPRAVYRAAEQRRDGFRFLDRT
jgi:hypothetical protein